MNTREHSSRFLSMERTRVVGSDCLLICVRQPEAEARLPEGAPDGPEEQTDRQLARGVRCSSCVVGAAMAPLRAGLRLALEGAGEEGGDSSTRGGGVSPSRAAASDWRRDGPCSSSSAP